MKKILGTITFLFLMMIIPNGVKASPPSNCNEIAPGNYTLGTNLNLTSGYYCIYEGAEVTIDLKGHDITSEEIDIYNQGKLLIKDSNYTQKQFDYNNLGEGYLSIYGDNESSNYKGELTIDNGNFQSIWIGNMISVTINNGLFFGNYQGIGIEYVKNIEIKGGLFQGINENGANIYDSENIMISGGEFDGTIKGNGIYLEGTENIIISGGNYTGYWDGIFLYDFNSIKLSGGTYKVTGEDDDGWVFGAIAIDGNNSNIFQEILEEGYKYSPEFQTKMGGDSNYPYAVAYIKEFSIEPIIVDYNILDGDNQEIDLDSDLVIRADGELSKFEKLLVDNEEVDQKYYETKEGSTIVTLKNEFIKTLSTGSHDITFVYKNGEASTKFTIKAADTESGNIEVPSSTVTAKTNLGPKKIKVPSTGMSVPMIITIVIINFLLIGGLIFGYSYMKSKKERNEVQK